MPQRVEAPPTRALSLIQPWAWAVLYAGKSVENRSWWSVIRGPFWIASSSSTTRRYYESACEQIRAISGVEVPPMSELVYGCIVGSAVIDDCILPGGYAAFDEKQGRVAAYRLFTGWPQPPPRHPLHPHPWHFQKEYGYVLKDVRAVTPVPCKGRQRWWTVPDEVLEQLNAGAFPWPNTCPVST